ncbi:MAG: glycosyltransferase family protein [Rhizobiaceae bacterium]
MTGRILFYVQHLMGVGHVFRSMRIVAALVRSGHKVDLAYGGEPVPNFDPSGANVHFLPPLRAGSTVFNDLEDPEGNVVGEDYRDRRREMLLSIFSAGQHDVIVTEAFPFGRRQMRFELLPLLEAAKRRSPSPLVIASVRDILQENRKPGRNEETVRLLRDHFDCILVHGDPNMVTLDETFPLFGEIDALVQYTGIVAPELPPTDAAADNAFDVVVSVGGGALGAELLAAAIGAKPLSRLTKSRWCLVTGINIADDDLQRLERMAEGNIEIRSFLPDLCAALSKAKLSISRCGYNTATDIFVSGCRSIVVPLSDGTETEQIRRAEILDRNGLAVRVDPEKQTPGYLAAAIDRALAQPKPADFGLDLSGAETTAQMISGMLANRT